MNKLAPICLFVYNRPEHTKKTLEALHHNFLSDQSTLYIFSDGSKDNASQYDIEKTEKVRKIIKEKNWCQKVIIKESKVNKGLAKSVIDGVTDILNEYEKIIVLEDDLITSKGFLKYMNDGLVEYEDEMQVMQVTGYNFPAKNILKRNSSLFLPIISTWGWATWKRVWNNTNFDINSIDINSIDKYKFNLNNSYNYLKLLKKQLLNKTSSWGILFYYNVFIKNGIVLYPDKSLVKNIGWDSSGKHKAKYELYSMLNWDVEYCINSFGKPEVNEYVYSLITRYLHRKESIPSKIISRVRELLNKIL